MCLYASSESKETLDMARQLIEAIRNGDQLQARNILLSDKYGCIDCQTAKRDGTALFWACAKGFVELVQLLISKGANVNARTNYNSTPLIAAADRNRHHVMRLVLQHGADVNAQTSKGDTACHLAAYRGHLEAVQVLLAAGADVDVTNTHFRTPYDDAVREGHVTILPYLEGSEKIEIESESIPNSSVRPPPHHYSRTSGHGVMGSAGHVGSRPCDGRRDSCDCTSNQSLSRESSYEDCGGQGIMNVVDFVDRLRSRDHHDLSYTDTLFPSSHPSLATSTFPPSRLSSGMDFGLANTRDLDFSTGGDYGFTAGGDLDYSKTGVDCGFKPSRDMVYPKAGGGGSSFAAGAEFSSPNGAEKRPYPYPTRYSERVAFPASGNPSFTASSLPFTYSDPGSNDLSLTSDRSSAQKNLISRLNIPA